MTNHVEIEKIELTRDFKYLWLYYITGINLDYHCQDSFRGKRSQKLNDKTHGFVDEHIVLDEVDTDYYYLCGGSKSEKWEENFHLAFRKKVGNIIDIEEHGSYYGDTPVICLEEIVTNAAFLNERPYLQLKNLLS